MNKYLEHLLGDSLVYYIYQRGSFIYGLNDENSDEDFLVVIDSKYQVPKEFKQYKKGKSYGSIKYNIQIDNYDFVFFEIQEWFNKVLECNIEAWECACLNKKFIKKEHVKLLMETNPLKLRENFNSEYKLYFSIADSLLKKAEYNKAKKYLWYLIKDVIFINQILVNHKIVNFKEANESRILLENCDNNIDTINELFNNLISSPLKYLKDSTDNLLMKKKLDKVKQKMKNE